jgi:hypothetical protein
MVQAVELLSNKCKALSSNTTEKKKKSKEKLKAKKHGTV